MRVVPLSADAAPSSGRRLMKSNTKTTWAVGTTAFLTIFAALCVPFDPTMAFALSLVAILAVKN